MASKRNSKQDRGATRLAIWSPDTPFRPARWPFFYGWVIVFSTSLGLLASMPGQTIGFSVFVETLMEELHLTRNGISLAYFAGTLMSGLLLPWGGVLFDRIGARRAMVGSSLMLGAVCLYFSGIDRVARAMLVVTGEQWALAASLAAATLGFFLIRFSGQGMMSITARAMLGKWFHHRRGIAQSVSGVTASFGFSITPLLLAMMLDGLGWRGSYVLLAVICGFGMAVLAWVFYRDNPEECGLKMDGEFVPAEGKAPVEDLVIYRDFSRAEAMRTFSFWAFNAMFCLHSFWFTGYAFHIVSIGEETGIGGRAILTFFLPATAVSIATNFLFGWLSDRTRLKYLLATINIAMALTGLCYPLLPSLAGAALLILGLGLTSGGSLAVGGIVFARFFGRTHLGAISGFAMSLNVVASAVGPYAFSLIFSATDSYRWHFLILLSGAMALVIGSWKADNPQRKLAETG